MSLNLLPMPKQVEHGDGGFALPDAGTLALHAPQAAELLFTARRLQAAAGGVGSVLDIAAGVPGAITLAVDSTVGQPQGYRLVINAEGVCVIGADAPGVFYGVLTLIQLIETHGRDLPAVTITDAPDFPARGVMLDISRDKVPTMDTLYELIDMLASWKINEVQLYTEHTFAYRNHKIVWEKASPITAEEVLLLDAYCRDRFIDLVPNQNSFGHMHRWFDHEPYKPLAETETEVLTPWGNVVPPFSLAPAVPGSIALVRELFDELLPNFSSPLFNVGCDETFDLGMGRTKAWCDTKGKGRVYLDFLLQIYALVSAHGRTMQFWGDIINQYPDLVPELPRDTIALEWGYEATHDFAGKTQLFAQSGIPFYVCPGTSSWTTIAGRTDNCVENIRNAVENGLKNGAIGVLNTDWGDLGHWQTLPVSYLGFAYGAAVSWAYEANVDLNLPRALDTYAFRDSAGVMGQLAYDLGNVYKFSAILIPNGSLLFWLMQSPLADLRGRLERIADRAEQVAGIDAAQVRALISDPELLADSLEQSIAHIESVMAPVNSARMNRPDAALIQSEFQLAAAMLQHGARHGIAQIAPDAADKAALLAELDGIVAQHRALWLQRNRPGGLDDSAARFDTARRTYTA